MASSCIFGISCLTFKAISKMHSHFYFQRIRQQTMPTTAKGFDGQSVKNISTDVALPIRHHSTTDKQLSIRESEKQSAMCNCCLVCFLPQHFIHFRFRYFNVTVQLSALKNFQLMLVVLIILYAMYQHGFDYISIGFPKHNLDRLKNKTQCIIHASN